MAANRVGKTYSGGAEHSFHLIGEYPKWWRGRVFQKPPRMWAASETTEMTTAGVQAALCGRVEDGIGTGAIPKALIYDAKPKKHGAAGSLEFVVTRWGVGGDTQGHLAYCGFKSYDQGRARFQADTLHAVWLDEEPEEELYFESLTRVMTTDGMVSLTFTPLRGMSRVVRRFMQEKPPGTHITRMALEDAGHFTPEKRAEQMARYPKHEQEARLKGIPKLGSGAVFPIPESQITVPRFKIPDHFACIAGIDFGWDHPSAAVQLAHDRDNDIVYVTRTHRIRETTPIVFSAAVRPWGDWLPWAWPHDGLQHDKGSGQQLAQQYADQGMRMLAERAQFADGSFGVEAGVTKMLDSMIAGRFKVFEDLRDWFEEYRMYHRVDGIIVKEEDDLMAATRYAWMCLRFAITKPVVRKPAHGERGRGHRVV